MKDKNATGQRSSGIDSEDVTEITNEQYQELQENLEDGKSVIDFFYQKVEEQKELTERAIEVAERQQEQIELLQEENQQLRDRLNPNKQRISRLQRGDSE